MLFKNVSSLKRFGVNKKTLGTLLPQWKIRYSKLGDNAKSLLEKLITSLNGKKL